LASRAQFTGLFLFSVVSLSCVLLLLRRLPPRRLPSFPTRRSSDLQRLTRAQPLDDRGGRLHGGGETPLGLLTGGVDLHQDVERRSEEHTSELQSRFDLVCRLLLEKKKYTLDKRSVTDQNPRTRTRT